MTGHPYNVGATIGEPASPTSQVPERIRILLVDANRFTAELLKAALTRYRHFEVTCSGVTIDEVNAAVVGWMPDIALLDYQSADGSASVVRALRRIAGLIPSARIVIISDEQSNGVLEAFRAGAKGIFHRSQSLPQLARCIQAVHEGQVWASSADLNLLLEAFADGTPLQCVNANGENLLSPREHQVVQLIAEGLSNNEIAEHLQITEHTVKNYLFKIYEKLGISNRVELILYVVTRRPAIA